MMIDYLYKDTITLFNRYEVDGSYCWFPHVLENVHWWGSDGASVSTYGDRATDNVSVNIRYGNSSDEPIIDRLIYVSPKKFRRIDYENAADYITFAYGDAFDFFIVGKYEADDEVISDDEYASSGGFFNYMNHENDEVYAITSCSKSRFLPHFTITGR